MSFLFPFLVLDSKSDVAPPPLLDFLDGLGINMFLCVASVIAKGSIYAASNYLADCGRSCVRESINCSKLFETNLRNIGVFSLVNIN